MKAEPGFETPIVMAFLEAHGDLRSDDKGLWTLNELRVSDSNRDTIERWRKLELVPLAKLDAMLMRYELMLFELEDWARANYGRDGWIDPYEEPAIWLLEPIC